MKAIVVMRDGLYIVRIIGNEGELYGIYVVDEVALRGIDQRHKGTDRSYLEEEEYEDVPLS